MLDSRRIPRAPSPQFLARLRFVAVQTISTRDQQLGHSVLGERHRGGERLARFLASVAGAHLFPKLLAGLRIEREQIRIIRAIAASMTVYRDIALQHLEVKLAVIKDRTAGESPVKGEWAVFLLNVAHPNLFAIEIISDHFAGPVKEHDQFAIGGR